MTQLQRASAPALYTPNVSSMHNEEQFVTMMFNDRNLFDGRPLVVRIERNTDGRFAYDCDVALRKMSASLGLGVGQHEPRNRYVNATYVVSETPPDSGEVRNLAIREIIELVCAEVCRIRGIPIGKAARVLH